MRQTVEFGRKVAQQAQKNDLSGLGAELSYRLFVASIPVFAFLATLGATVAGALGGENPAQSIVDSIGDSLPSDFADTFEQELEGLIDSSGVATLLTTLAGALWAGSLAMGSVVKALDRIHGATGERPKIRKWLFVLALTVAAGVLLVTALVGLMLSQVYHDDIADWVGLGAPSSAVVTGVAWLVAFAVVVAAASILYQAVPPTETRTGWISLGGLAFGVIWLIGSIAFLVYVANFDSYASTYGALGAVLVAAGWLYFSCSAFLVGAQLDLALHERRADGRGS